MAESLTDADLSTAETMRRIRGSKTPWIILAIVTLASVGAIYWLRGQLQLADARAAAAETASVQLQRQHDALTRARTDLEKRVAELEHETADLTALNNRLSSDVQSKDEELAKLKVTYDALEQKMKAEIGAGDIRLTNVGGRLQVDLVDKILFDSGDATISKRGEEVLSRVGQVLATIRDKQIQVSGHTDTQRISEKIAAQFPTNWELSVARATNVTRFLQEKAGVPSPLLVASGYGEFHPVASNATPQGRARNRRIEILLTPIIQPVAK